MGPRMGDAHVRISPEKVSYQGPISIEIVDKEKWRKRWKWEIKKDLQMKSSKTGQIGQHGREDEQKSGKEKQLTSPTEWIRSPRVNDGLL